MLALALGALTGATLQTRGNVILMVMIVCLIAVIVMMLAIATENTDSYKNGRRWALLTGTCQQQSSQITAIVATSASSNPAQQS